tara:strand:+ start:222 stop:1784 length:1563 start_codon:yes stop_codon:yes gene_type:complete
MPPFTQDAMGDVFFTPDMEFQVIEMALWLSEITKIPLSATFNNIYVRPDQKGLDMFLTNFRELYDLGVRIVTLPHTSWVLTGQIQKEYPELYIKNTILREVTRPNEIVELARAGFHYINLDRDLMRDKDRLIEIKEAKEYCAEQGYPVKLSILVNEGCWGNCPIMPEHYHYNNTRNGDDPQYFNDTISRVSCSKWDAVEGGLAALKAANLPPWKSDWQEFLELGIDVFKLHGRESATRLKESMDIIDRWVLDKELLFPQFQEYIDDTNIKERPIDVWREKIKTCKFNCWKCSYCDKVYDTAKNNKVNPKINKIIEAIDKAELGESNYTGVCIESLTSETTKHFLNNICAIEGTKYLELGVYGGGTFYSALQNNNVFGYAVDDFKKRYVSPERDDIEFTPFNNPKTAFLTPPWYPDKRYNFKLIEGNISEVEIPEQCNVIFYDADHDPVEQYKNLQHIWKYCDDEFILLVDDANMPGVIDSVDDLIRSNNPTVLFERKILTSIPEDLNSWWNGLYILLIKK